MNNLVRHRGRLFLIALTCLLAGIASAEERRAAVPPVEKVEVRLHYDRHELDSPAGARHLLLRIKNAAMESCGASAFSFPDYKAAVLASQCFKEAVDGAVRRIDCPLLSEVAGDVQR